MWSLILKPDFAKILLIESDTMYLVGSLTSAMCLISWIPVILLYLTEMIIVVRIDKENAKYKFSKLVNRVQNIGSKDRSRELKTLPWDE